MVFVVNLEKIRYGREKEKNETGEDFAGIGK